MSGSVLGAIREKLYADAAFKASTPGGIHANELSPVPAAGPGTNAYPAVVLRYLKTDFTYLTGKASIEKPKIEVWIECLAAEQGEVIARAAKALLVDKPLPLSTPDAAGVASNGSGTVQVYCQDFYLHPDSSRNAAGQKQYSWCLVLEVWLEKRT